jgi:ABC-type nitrate/sulfonate/bicarbonate transport system substrate-binding protein
MQFNLIARAELAALQPQTMRRFVAALDHSLRFLREKPEEARRLTLQATKEDPASFSKVWRPSDFTLALNQSLLEAVSILLP